MFGKLGGVILIKMVLYDVPNVSEGLDEAMVSLSSQVGAFVPMLLFFVFCTIFLGGSINQKRRTGSADMPMWAATASIATMLISLIFTLRSGIIQLEVLSIVITITIFSGFWLFMDRNRNEV